ncbi:GxxExxY protein [Pedobacter sp. Hv1]|uniref:GxxExxY protein n=1 Tax=Pedobacter sp. Hv1 TaxID=1740090 RepID=UPI0006D8AC4E|nr:GxxExxY protein [Pedobacter sp. Hv1]KQB98996.1 GxxExxY protein [Pedobacter sp. Hv1]
MINKAFLDDLEYRVTGACIEVHKILGPGLLESIYHQCLARELQVRDINFSSECKIQIVYKGTLIDSSLRADLFIEDCSVLELKAIDNILPIHEAQILTYMRILKAPKGLLINFNCTNIIQFGKKPFVNEFYHPFLE